MEDLSLAQAGEQIVQQLGMLGVVIGIPVLDKNGFITEQANNILKEFAPAIFALAYKLVDKGHKSPNEIRKLAKRIRMASPNLEARPETATTAVNVFSSKSLVCSQRANDDSIKHRATKNKLALSRRPSSYGQFRSGRKIRIARGLRRHARV